VSKERKDERGRRHERRSELVARLHRRYLQDVDEQERLAGYAAAYMQLPETPEERWLVEQSIATLSTDLEQ
jgi:metal-responsive CopG/Arc/MetJ family transcriptional regulator